ncbi:hypothetical protein C6P40_002948 [Pichia californica]|uniref:tRNA wybutosine-synthesizing protein 3 n=1 Tax=Pichia californica TaxID=460514 RepID=A0A9P7BDP0_9ASCO|nr:hypothetical protein C6P42_002733 [[Candida] californica]KAG0687061.1 hypothetical protein C6P40_002948 [[Candida] californica]
MVTTSSCSGRVSVFVEGSKELNTERDNPADLLTADEAFKIGAKGEGGHWLFVSHEKEDINEWWMKTSPLLKFEKSSDKEYNIKTRYILFKYEPLILHVQCRDFKSASRLYSSAMGCGFRESGIGANNNVAIRISIRLDVPIGYINNKDELISVVDEAYLKMITKLAFDRFLENERKMEKLYNRIDEEVIQYIESTDHIETKEERKERKMQEGLARRDEVRKLKEEKKRLKQLELENVAAATINKVNLS